MSKAYIASSAILVAIVLMIVGAVLVSKTPPPSSSRDVSNDKDNNQGKRVAGIVILVLGCAGILVCSVIIGMAGNKEIKHRFVNNRDVVEDQYGFGSDF